MFCVAFTFAFDVEQFPIAIGCVEFVALKQYIDKSDNSEFCIIKISSANNCCEEIDVPIGEISGKTKKLKELLEQKYKICFTNSKCFELWCSDISRKILNCCAVTNVLPDYYYKDGEWILAPHLLSKLSYSEQMAVLSPWIDKVSSCTTETFGELTFVLYGVLGKMFSVLKENDLSDIAALLIVSSDMSRTCNTIKKNLSLSPKDIIMSKGATQKELDGRTENSMLLIVIDGSKHIMNKVVSEYSRYLSIETGCRPIFTVGKLDNIVNNDNLQYYFSIELDSTLSENINDVILIILREVFKDNNTFDSFKKSALKFRTDYDCELTYNQKNLFSLLIALTRVILSSLGLKNPEDFSQRYLNYLLKIEAYNLLNTLKLKELLLKDTDYEHCSKSELCKLDDDVLCIGKDVVSVSSNTMLGIAKKMGFDSVNSFAVCLNENSFLKTSGKSYMDAINLDGSTKRVYSFHLPNLFSFGEALPYANTVCEGEVIRIPIGKTENGDNVAYPLIKGSNNSIFISGCTGSGKTNLCNIIAENAEEVGISVLIVGKESTVEYLAPSQKNIVFYNKEQQISWSECLNTGITKIAVKNSDIKLTDNILDSFFNYKMTDNSKTITLLILDEIQDFSWNGNSPIKQILRQGRKYNIVPVMSTQFLNSDNGTNIADALKQINIFCCFKEGIYPKKFVEKYPQLKNCVENLNNHDALIFDAVEVNGHIVNQPIKFKTEKFQ